MTPRTVLILFVSLVLAPPAFAADDRTPSAGEAMRRLMDDAILPGYRELEARAKAFSSSTGQLCEVANEQSLGNAREAFSGLVRGWGGIEMVRFGPILADNTLERFFFFPDRRGSGLKRVQKMLAEKDPALLEPDRLIASSVAAQGLFAAEYVLFGTGAEKLAGQPQSYRCQYGHAVAENLQAIASHLKAGWESDREFVKMWRQPGSHNPVFGDDDAALTHIISTVVHGLEEVRDVRLSAFLKETPQKDRAKSAPLWRSENTLPLLLADIESIEKIYRVSRLSDFLPPDQKLLDTSVESQFAELEKAADIKGEVAALIANPEDRARLERLRTVLGVLINTLERDFAAAIGLRVGFFFADGD